MLCWWSLLTDCCRRCLESKRGKRLKCIVDFSVHRVHLWMFTFFKNSRMWLIEWVCVFVLVVSKLPRTPQCNCGYVNAVTVGKKERSMGQLSAIEYSSSDTSFPVELKSLGALVEKSSHCAAIEWLAECWGIPITSLDPLQVWSSVIWVLNLAILYELPCTFPLIVFQGARTKALCYNKVLN